ncbi:MAG: SDR family NAD(P)-dependent oxidoreductase [Burkholderiaceae bacterium]
MKTLVIVTGHSRGLGAALVAELLPLGCEVWGLSRSAMPSAGGKTNAPTAAKPPADGASQARAQGFMQTAIDLADAQALLGLVQSQQWRDALASADRVFLINNAGLLTPIALVGSQDDAQILQSVAANVGAALVLANAMVRQARPQADRRILHVSSGAARTAYAGWNVYCATKAALDHHARCMALEQDAQSNPVRIASLAPGVIDTEMQAQVRSTAIEAFPMRPRFDVLKESGALQKPEDVARRMVGYLLSPQFGSEVVTDLRTISPAG